MRKHSGRLLLVAGTLCWFSPAYAEREPDSPKQQTRKAPNTPEARAKWAKEKAESAKPGKASPVILIPRSDSLGVIPVFDPNRAVLLP